MLWILIFHEQVGAESFAYTVDGCEILHQLKTVVNIP